MSSDFDGFGKIHQDQKCQKPSKSVKKCKNDILEGPPRSKNQQTVAKQAKIVKKSIKNRSKNGQKVVKKGQKSAGKMPFWGSKSIPRGTQKCQKVPFLDIRRVKNDKILKIPKQTQKSIAKKLRSKTRIVGF